MEYKNLPDLKALAALRAVFDKGGVSEAARTLNISQPAISKRLRSLETCYDAVLTERVAGRLCLTEAGERVYNLAVQVLDRNLALHRELQALASGRNTLNLELSMAIGEHFLSGWLRDFALRQPDSTVHSRLGYSRHIETHLARAAIDLAVLESAPDHPDVFVQRWADDELWVVCGHGHPLAEQPMIELETFAAQRFILRERRASARETLEQTLAQIGIDHLAVDLEVGSNDALVDLLGDRQHLSVLPQFVAESPRYAERLQRIRIRGLRIKRTLWIARHRDKLKHPVADAFVAMLLDR